MAFDIGKTEEMMGEPQPGWLRWNWTSHIFTGRDREERAARLAQVPENMRGYVKTRVEAIFGFNNRRRG